MSEGAERRDVNDAVVVAATGDITAEEVDAIVNAANARLKHGGGVAAAIATAGGTVIQEESDAWVAEHGPLDAGMAAVTSAGKMPARHVVHVVGPIYDPDSQDNRRLLATAVTAALDAAREASDRSIAFPAISAGTYGYPRAQATRVIVQTVAEWLGDHEGGLDEVRLVGFDAGTTEDFARALGELGG